MYCEKIESGYENENQRLSRELEETKLDLIDSTKSRRDLQTQMKVYEAELIRISQENETIKVTLSPLHCHAALVNRL